MSQSRLGSQARPRPSDAGPVKLARELLSRFEAAPARFHLGGASDWSVSATTIQFLAQHVSTGGATLETGAGLSTVLFAALGVRHLCVCPDVDEAERIQAYCRAEGIDADGLTFLTELSETALPGLETPPLDLVLIDGGHGFPMPMIDWYFTAAKLKIGGVLVIDDTHLWPCALLVDFLRHDAGWTLISRIGRRTIAFRKAGPFAYREFCFQPYVMRRSRMRTVMAKVLAGWDLLRAGDVAEIKRRIAKH